MTVPFFDLTRQYSQLAPEIEPAVRDVLASGRYILGEAVARFEQQAAQFFRVKHAIGVASGTHALELSLRACGIGPGDEVITTPFSFFATAEMISVVGARPIFVDIDEDTLNIDPKLIEKAITTRTRAIMPVHLFGLCAEMTTICEIAQRRGLKVFEDAAQAFGGSLDGVKAGALADMACFSFFPTKNLGACGDAGLVTTNDDSLAAKVRMLSVHGSRQRYIHETLGGCGRLDTLQAAILSVKLKRLEQWNEKRRRIAFRYCEGLTNLPLVLPPCNHDHIYHQFTIRTSHRERLIAHLEQHGIGNMIYYPVPIHLQPAYGSLGHCRGDFPVAERAAQEVLSLPIFPELEDREVEEVISAVRGAF